MTNKGYAKFWGANKVYYGTFANGEFLFLNLDRDPENSTPGGSPTFDKGNG